MRGFFHRHSNFKYTVRGFIFGVVCTTIIGGIFLVSCTAKADTMPIEEEQITPVETTVDLGDPVNVDELDMLAHLLGGEAGSDWCSDEMIYYVGSVVLNRVDSPNFPNTIEDVIFQSGQYACTWDGNYERVPSERCYRIAEELLRYGSVLPGNVVYQAEFKQGSGVFKKVQNMYFCYQ